MQKECKQCKLLKPMDQFYDHKFTKDKKVAKCKECQKIYQENRKNLPEVKERRKQTDAMYYKNNKEKHRLNWWKHREKRLHEARLWKKNNKEKIRELNRKRRELKRLKHESDYLFSLEYQTYIFNLFENKCFRCKGTTRLSIDHHIPSSKGGILKLGNVVLLCGSCNSSKRDKDPHIFYTPEEFALVTKLLEQQISYCS